MHHGQRHLKVREYSWLCHPIVVLNMFPELHINVRASLTVTREALPGAKDSAHHQPMSIFPVAGCLRVPYCGVDALRKPLDSVTPYRRLPGVGRIREKPAGAVLLQRWHTGMPL
jgi:hypothetical protein